MQNFNKTRIYKIARCLIIKFKVIMMLLQSTDAGSTCRWFDLMSCALLSLFLNHYAVIILP